MLNKSTRKNTNPLYFFVVVTKLRLELPNIAEVAVYLATQYVQTTTYIVLYGSASLHSPLLGMSPVCHTKIGKKERLKECVVIFKGV